MPTASRRLRRCLRSMSCAPRSSASFRRRRQEDRGDQGGARAHRLGPQGSQGSGRGRAQAGQGRRDQGGGGEDQGPAGKGRGQGGTQVSVKSTQLVSG